jgi:hypothetical protein
VTSTEYASGQLKTVDVGEVLMTIELLPRTVAEAFPAGKGRKEPNQHPVSELPQQ